MTLVGEISFGLVAVMVFAEWAGYFIAESAWSREADKVRGEENLPDDYLAGWNVISWSVRRFFHPFMATFTVIGFGSVIVGAIIK